jgi:FixJ family two-component response regulator
MSWRRETIVVVDDDEDLRGAVREVLEDLEARAGAC